MTEKNFFRDATLAICGSLDIEIALWRCLFCIRECLPAELLSLHLYERESGLLETVAYASLEGGQKCSFKNRLSDEIRMEIENRRSRRIWVVDQLGYYDGTKDAAANIKGTVNMTGIIMDLVLDKKLMGVFMVAAKSKDCFTKEHLSLIKSINRPLAIALTNSIRFRELKQIQERLADDNRYFQNELRRKAGQEVIGAESGLRNTMEMVKQIAPLDSPVLLLGETGVGKELIAGSIHNVSGRRDKNMLTVNCGAIPPTLMDSELFGYEKGAFTGALALKRGIFERANGGTVFLDEIGELVPEAQVRLLRVLEQKEIHRVGGNGKIKLNIRIIAATHRNLESMVKKGQFREDLFFRLNVFPICIPPVRERQGDIPALIQHFIAKKSIEMKLRKTPMLAQGEIERMMAYSWPGNVREIENTVERALILNRGKNLYFGDFYSNCEKKVPYNKQDEVHNKKNEILSLDKIMAAHIKRVLEMTDGKIHGKDGAAQKLSINPNTLRHRMKKLGISSHKTFYHYKKN
jgi:transcriptional regulator with GAF, ATPase, and Fis domain